MAFHDPTDAIAWAMEVQHMLPWPEELLTQTDSKEEYTPESLAKQMLLFKGFKDRTLCDMLQVAPFFGDAPGVTRSHTRTAKLTRQVSIPKSGGFQPPKSPPPQADLPEVTMVFCGPAQYKVSSFMLC